MRIDSHQHFWNYDPQKHAWINEEMSVLKRDFLPPDLKSEIDSVDIDGSVAVQASQTEVETQFLLDLADKYDYVKGVVGWLDIRDDNFEQRLNHFSQFDALKGLRHIVQDEPDDRFLLQPDFLGGIKTLSNFDLTYDILIFARHLPVAVEFASKFSDQKFVLDHIAKPEIKDQKIDEWEEGIRELAKHPKMYCKVSGMVTEADWDQWQPDDFRPYLDVVFDAFGTDRLMFGSDWPVCLLAGDYKEVYKLVKSYIDTFTDIEQTKLLGGNAQQFYNL
ncbi:amidohydrolase family protein [Aliifodinibius sp. S!AR15-10]|uniref:amidohydrolase family protein n=1 Tax=Aliifodinibius sp. S!AR15-10 TaxID=2950437 RepID=UPI00285CE948|nr:amidohydrolase family protein [Aliifodinibius sp. S!AR15-10]MDR8392721.1 amidohydrolase family protein [Aliifodinibius sp. S!AR15-10]